MPLRLLEKASAYARFFATLVSGPVNALGIRIIHHANITCSRGRRGG